MLITELLYYLVAYSNTTNGDDWIRDPAKLLCSFILEELVIELASQSFLQKSWLTIMQIDQYKIM